MTDKRKARVAREVKSIDGRWAIGDEIASKPLLEELGFTDIEEYDQLTYYATLPDGWTAKADGTWTTFHDGDREERIIMFFKNVFGDRDSFLAVTKSGKNSMDTAE